MLPQQTRLKTYATQRNHRNIAIGRERESLQSSRYVGSDHMLFVAQVIKLKLKRL